MKAATIIMQQRKIEKENEEAKRKMAYDIIRDWVDENKDYFSELLLKRVIKKFTEKKAERIEYRCICGACNYPLGEKYEEKIGLDWKEGENFVCFNNNFFNSSPIEKTEYNNNVCKMFISHYVFHTTFPELLRDEGFVVSHHGCGCSEEIIIKLPNE